jgi:hypothetical protein
LLPRGGPAPTVRRFKPLESTVGAYCVCAIFERVRMMNTNVKDVSKPSLRLLIDHPGQVGKFLEFEKIHLKGQPFKEGPIHIHVSMEMAKIWHQKLSKMIEHSEVDSEK